MRARSAVRAIGKPDGNMGRRRQCRCSLDEGFALRDDLLHPMGWTVCWKPLRYKSMKVAEVVV